MKNAQYFFSYILLIVLTQSVFVRVEEYTDTDDLEESYQIWENLLSQLKEIIGA